MSCRPFRHVSRVGHSEGPPITRLAATALRSETLLGLYLDSVDWLTTSTSPSVAGDGSSTVRFWLFKTVLSLDTVWSRGSPLVVDVSTKLSRFPAYSGTRLMSPDFRAPPMTSRLPMLSLTVTL